MLRELSVQNLATIEDARVELEPGFTAWTGETGAGKSLLLTALGLVTGGKASSDLVRAGKEEARAAAVFDLEDDRLRGEIEEILGGRVEDAQLIVTRRISAAGRSQAHANGLPVTAATLRKLGGRLIDIHGQHEGRALLEPERQRALLDAYGKLEAQARQVREAWQAHDTLLRRRRALVEANERRQREHALLSFERDELEALDPQEGEPAELASEAHRLANIAELQSATSAAYGALYEADGSVQDRVDQVARRLEPLAKAAPELAAIAADLDRIGDEVRDLARQVQRLNQGSEEDPERLEEVESRLARYRKLAARFRCAPEGLVAVRARVAAQLAAIDQADAKLAALDQPLAEAWNSLRRLSVELSTARGKAAKALTRAVQGQLKHLALEDATIRVVVESRALGDDPLGESAPSEGMDQVEIVFAPNPGEPPRPLRRIASGGELSRVTLAVKSVLAEVDRVTTLVFDEVDAGVGGRLGSVLGRVLRGIARHRQILCVTHLPQLASYAERQWVVRKKVQRGRTRTSIEPLSETERIDELAAMLRGGSVAERTRQEALAMLEEARCAP